MDFMGKVHDSATDCYENTKDGIVTCIEKIQCSSRTLFESFLNLATYASSGLDDAKLFGNVNKETKQANNSNGAMLTNTPQPTRNKETSAHVFHVTNCHQYWELRATVLGCLQLLQLNSAH
ncbi:hypothetical protein DPMN_121567 [Dreissena polymorpha]|uniref:Uncharacterized protein n=1 Tax=Dreissena polymorpha TaxID=45954 RepID=A0A9D4GQR8_DREPO|nr:hypothetical protein DPMN_121567 [Dreissena polymorpha]